MNSNVKNSLIVYVLRIKRTQKKLIKAFCNQIKWIMDDSEDSGKDLLSFVEVKEEIFNDSPVIQ